MPFTVVPSLLSLNIVLITTFVQFYFDHSMYAILYIFVENSNRHFLCQRAYMKSFNHGIWSDITFQLHSFLHFMFISLSSIYYSTGLFICIHIL